MDQAHIDDSIQYHFEKKKDCDLSHFLFLMHHCRCCRSVLYVSVTHCLCTVILFTVTLFKSFIIVQHSQLIHPTTIKDSRFHMD